MFIKGRKTIINMEAIKIIKIEHYSYCFKINAYDFDDKKYTLILIPDVENKDGLLEIVKTYDIAKIAIETIFKCKTKGYDVDLLEIVDFLNEEYKIKNKILTLI